jgi:hypothetical protein
LAEEGGWETKFFDAVGLTGEQAATRHAANPIEGCHFPSRLMERRWKRAEERKLRKIMLGDAPMTHRPHDMQQQNNDSSRITGNHRHFIRENIA